MTDIIMRPIVSSSVVSAGYNGAARELRILFKSGGLYAYHDVPPEKYDALLVDPSPGGFARRELKDYRYERLDGSTSPAPKPAARPIEEAAGALHEELQGTAEYGGSVQVEGDSTLVVRLAPNVATSPAIRTLLRQGFVGYPVIATSEDRP